MYNNFAASILDSVNLRIINKIDTNKVTNNTM